MKVKGLFESLWGAQRHVLTSLDGQPILSIKREVFTFDRLYTVFSPDGRPMLEIRRLNAQLGGKWKAGVFLVGQSVPLVVLKGSPFDGCYYGFIGDPKAPGSKKILEVIRER